MIHADHINNPKEIIVKLVPGEEISDYLIDLVFGVKSDDDYITRYDKVNNRMQGYMNRLMKMYNHTK